MKKGNKKKSRKYLYSANFVKKIISTLGIYTMNNNILNLSSYRFLAWQNFIIFYLILRLLFGVTYPLIYFTIILMFLARIDFEKIAMAFFLIALVVYLFGQDVEANHYFSFVYVFLFLTLLKYLYLLLKERFEHTKA